MSSPLANRPIETHLTVGSRPLPFCPSPCATRCVWPRRKKAYISTGQPFQRRSPRLQRRQRPALQHPRRRPCNVASQLTATPANLCSNTSQPLQWRMSPLAAAAVASVLTASCPCLQLGWPAFAAREGPRLWQRLLRPCSIVSRLVAAPASLCSSGVLPDPRHCKNLSQHDATLQ